MRYKRFWFVLVGTVLASSVLSDFEASAEQSPDYCSPENIRTGRSNAAFCDDPPNSPRDIPDGKNDDDHADYDPFSIEYPAPTPPPGCTRKQHYAYLSHRAARLLVAGKLEESKMHRIAAEGYRQAGVELSDDEGLDSMMALGWDRHKKNHDRMSPSRPMPDEWTPDWARTEWGKKYAGKDCSGGTLPSLKPEPGQRQSSSSPNSSNSSGRQTGSRGNRPTLSRGQSENKDSKSPGSNLPFKRVAQAEQQSETVDPKTLEPEQGGRSIHPDLLQPGDIILVTTNSAQSRGIRAVTGEPVSHAMLYVGHGLVIESISQGVVLRTLEEGLDLSSGLDRLNNVGVNLGNLGDKYDQKSQEFRDYSEMFKKIAAEDKSGKFTKLLSKVASSSSDALGDGYEKLAEGANKASNLKLLKDSTVAVTLRHPAVNQEMRESIVNFAGGQVGKSYGWLGIDQQLGFRADLYGRDELTAAQMIAINLGKGKDQSFYCSELVLAAYRAAGVSLAPSNNYSPGEIAELDLAYVGHLIGGGE